MVMLTAAALPMAAESSEPARESGPEWRFNQTAVGWNGLRTHAGFATGPEAATTGPARPLAHPVALLQEIERDAATVKDGTESGASGGDDACKEADGECREALSKLRADTLASIDLDIRIGGRPGNDYPCECRLEGETYKPRQFATTTFTWKAAGYCHKPLYFEQWNLERYGHSHGFIPDFFLSGAHFFVTLPILPYKMGVELPWECVYPLGYYRPGNCAPWTCPAVPISGRGLALEAATITGVVFLLP